MQNNTVDYCTLSYVKNLETIAGIKFTPRELDIIACILSGRAVKKIGDFLGIAPKTIETHMRNMMAKLECNSREGIIDFIEKSDKASLLRKHYQNLLIQGELEHALRKIHDLISKESLTNLIVFWESQAHTSSFIATLKDCLHSAGIKTLVEEREGIDFSAGRTSSKVDHTLYVLQGTDVNQEAYIKKSKGNLLDPHAIEESSNTTYLLLEGRNIPQGLQSGEYIDFRNPDTFYIAILKLLKRLVPDTNLSDIIQDFNSRYRAILGSEPSITPLEKEELKATPKKAWPNIFKETKYIAAIFGTICIVLLALWFLASGTTQKNSVTLTQSIRSDLLIPNKSALLKRHHLLSKIEDQLRNQQGIQTVALIGIVGMGGVGKTTLARQFGRMHDSVVVWEINAESKEYLMNSFKDLAYALVKAPEEKDEIDFIEKIQDSLEKEKLLVSFVKKRLKQHPGWLLIYDNVEEFSDIKNFFPGDSQAWGDGKVIITTRDSNIKNHTYINPQNIIEMGELTSTESLVLLSKVLYGRKPDTLTTDQKEKAINFLKNIPPFPLDISLAAYYIKDTNISYEEYLKRIGQYHNTPQENPLKDVLKEVSDYTKTRYEIITLSFKKLIEVNPDYRDLLLLICMLDSQQIPRSLLEVYKDPATVDKFIHGLRKYSLIVSESTSGAQERIFSLHRATQSLGKEFLFGFLTQEEINILIDNMVTAIQNFYESFSDKQSKNIPILLPHLTSFLEDLNLLMMSADLKAKYKKDLLLIMGGIYASSGNYILAERSLFQVYQEELKKRSLSNRTLALLLKDLGSVYCALEFPEKAITFAQESIKLSSTLDDADIILAKNLRNLGYAYTHQNNFEEAKRYYNAALEKIAKLDVNTSTKELKAVIYDLMSWLYSATYITKPLANESFNYALNSLEILNGNRLFYKNPKHHPGKISCALVKHRVTLGYAYRRAGKYKEAMEQGFNEAQYILDKDLDACEQSYVRLKLALGVGEVLLREGKLEAAKEKLTESIKSEKVVGTNNIYLPIPGRVFRAETNIRLKHFDEAYEDCSTIFKADIKSYINYSKLLHITSYYHAAFIKYKQDDLKKSLAHFAEFSTRIKAFCKLFLDPEAYKALEKKGAFTTPVYSKKRGGEDIKKCLKNSVAIYTAIYGSSHLFVTDYLIPNYEELNRPWF